MFFTQSMISLDPRDARRQCHLPAARLTRVSRRQPALLTGKSSRPRQEGTCVQEDALTNHVQQRSILITVVVGLVVVLATAIVIVIVTGRTEGLQALGALVVATIGALGTVAWRAREPHN